MIGCYTTGDHQEWEVDGKRRYCVICKFEEEWIGNDEDGYPVWE